jgi:hypothetical protein
MSHHRNELRTRHGRSYLKGAMGPAIAEPPPCTNPLSPPLWIFMVVCARKTWSPSSVAVSSATRRAPLRCRSVAAHSPIGAHAHHRGGPRWRRHPIARSSALVAARWSGGERMVKERMGLGFPKVMLGHGFVRPYLMQSRPIGMNDHDERVAICGPGGWQTFPTQAHDEAWCVGVTLRKMGHGPSFLSGLILL